MLKHLLRRACVQHLVYRIVSSDIDSSAAGRDRWADFKGQDKKLFRTIQCTVLQCQGIRLEIEGLPGLGQTEKTNADMLITFQNSHMPFKFLGSSEPLPLGSFHPWLNSK